MQKNKLIPLSTMLLCSLCLSACAPNITTTNVIARIDGTDITVENVYDTSLYNKEVASHVYETLEKALINSSIPVNNTMRTHVEDEVEAWDQKIKDDAKLNKTDYKEDLKKALQEQSVNSIQELKNKKIYELQKQAAKTEFLKAKDDEYANLYVKNNYLYHIGDILLSVTGDSSNLVDYYSLTLTESEAKEIVDAVMELVNGLPYYSVAINHSSSESKNNGGDEGIVTLKDEDISNELRYSLIGYSSIFEGKYEEIKEKLDLPLETEHEEYVNDIYSKTSENFGIESIPLTYLENLNKNIDVHGCYEETNGGVYTQSKVYYRNILFNNLLNTKSPKFITLNAQQVTKYKAEKRVIDARTLGLDVLVPTTEEVGYRKANDNEDQYVLTNDDGYPYVVYKDSKGLHITTIHMSPFNANYERYFITKADANDEVVSYIEYGDLEARKKEVDMFSTRYFTKDFGDSESNDKLLDFEIFKYFKNKNKNFKIVDKTIEDLLNQYMTATENLTVFNAKVRTDDHFNKFATDLFTRKYILKKEIPLLSCLEKDGNNDYKCTYVYGQGFSYRTGDVTPEGGNK